MMVPTMMTWKEFAVTLFELEDADPGYMMLARAKMPVDQKMRFMVGWCTFYNPGIAARASEFIGRRFWAYLHEQYPTAKRASERRHFRGAAGINAINSWERNFVTPEAMVEHIQGDDYFEVAHNCNSVAQMGSYFIWKWCDLQERVLRIHCVFTDSAAAKSPKVPQQGAKLINPDKTVLETYNEISAYMNSKGMLSPPWYDRPMNMQEGETVCCVYKQYSKGKWAPHTRTAKATNSLLATPSDTASEMLKALHSKTGVKLGRYQQWASDKLNQLDH